MCSLNVYHAHVVYFRAQQLKYLTIYFTKRGYVCVGMWMFGGGGVSVGGVCELGCVGVCGGVYHCRLTAPSFLPDCQQIWTPNK